MISEQKRLKALAADKHNALLRASKISLILEGYNDIFSDFDPRPYSERALSDDFLIEAKKAVRSRSAGTDRSFELSFFIPQKERNPEDEFVIKRRLQEHFKKHHSMIHEEVSALKRKGIRLAVVGAVLGIVATLVGVAEVYPLLKSLLLILLEPASWFTIWTGFECIYSEPGTKKHELEFYEKMSQASISFQSY